LILGFFHQFHNFRQNKALLLAGEVLLVNQLAGAPELSVDRNSSLPSEIKFDLYGIKTPSELNHPAGCTKPARYFQTARWQWALSRNKYFIAKRKFGDEHFFLLTVNLKNHSA